MDFDESFNYARQNNSELEKHIKKALDDLNPLRTLKLFRLIRRADRELLGLRDANPESFLWRFIPAPPVCIRPSVGQDGSSTEDDLTAKLGDIVAANNALRDALEKGAPVQNIVEHWDYLALQLALYINSDVPGLAKAEFGKQIRGFVQRLKGKQGRFRGNLSGKRVDFSGRTVISPDPNLGHRRGSCTCFGREEHDLPRGCFTAQHREATRKNQEWCSNLARCKLCRQESLSRLTGASHAP